MEDIDTDTKLFYGRRVWHWSFHEERLLRTFTSMDVSGQSLALDGAPAVECMGVKSRLVEQSVRETEEE
jgi:hypothetical protein